MGAPLRWGIAGTGKISSDFVNAVINNLERNEHKIEAIAARKLDSAQDFTRTLGISAQALEGYEALATHPDVDVVYVGTIHKQSFSNLYMSMINCI